MASLYKKCKEHLEFYQGCNNIPILVTALMLNSNTCTPKHLMIQQPDAKNCFGLIQ